MKYALIGCGRISPNHVMAAKNNGLEIVAVCDIVRANAEDKILKFDLDPNKVKIYEDTRNCLQRKSPNSWRSLPSPASTRRSLSTASLQAAT